MRVRIDATVRFVEADAPARLVASLAKALTFQPPNRDPRGRAKNPAAQAPDRIEALEREDGFEGTTIIIPRGALPILARLMQDYRLPLEVDSGAGLGEALAVTLNRQLRPYQAAAVEAMVARKGGLVVAPCGAGKSTIGLGAIARLGRTALVLVHTTDLLAQWRDDIERVFGFKPGVVGTGRRAVRPVTVGMLQALVRMSDWDLADVAGRFGTVVCDEVHHCPAVTVRQVLEKIGARYRYGLSATPEREDGLTPIIHWVVGPEIYRIGHEELRKAGHLVDPEVWQVQTGWTADLAVLAQRALARARQRLALEGKTEGEIRKLTAHLRWKPGDRTPKWLCTEIYSALAEDAGRNALVVDVAARELGGGHSLLILANRKAQCELLVAALRDRGYPAEFLNSTVAKTQRKAILDRFRSGLVTCVAATQLADEGLDVPRLDRLILVSPSRAEGKTIQRIGRLMRPCEDKGTPVLIDLVDDLGMFQAQAQVRAKVYRKALGSLHLHSIRPPGLRGQEELWRRRTA